MSVSEASTPARTGDHSSTRCRAFGIDIESSVHVPGAPLTTPGTRRTTLVATSAQELDAVWRPTAPTRALERRRRNGELVMTVDHDPKLGYRVYAPRDGLHLVSSDGAHIGSALPDIAPWRWQRLLLAQVLPLAATLQGLELLHASAVEWKGRTLAFVARSGTGKTSAAAHMVAAGARPLTDDVLALEEIGGAIVGHPGAGTMSIDSAELERMTAEGRRRVGRRLGASDKVLLSCDLAGCAGRLDTLFLLQRRAAGGLAIDRVDPDPLLVLAHSFNTYVRTAERIENQLAIAARLTETVPMYSVQIPPGSDAPTVARAIIDQTEST